MNLTNHKLTIEYHGMTVSWMYHCELESELLGTFADMVSPCKAKQR